MSETILKLAIVLAYGPLLGMLVLYGVALGLSLFGRRWLLELLVRRTDIPEPVTRAVEEEHELPLD